MIPDWNMIIILIQRLQWQEAEFTSKGDRIDKSSELISGKDGLKFQTYVAPWLCKLQSD